MRPVRNVVTTLLVPALLGGAGAVLAATTLGPAAPASAATAPCVAVVVDARLAGGPLGGVDAHPGRTGVERQRHLLGPGLVHLGAVHHPDQIGRAHV